MTSNKKTANLNPKNAIPKGKTPMIKRSDEKTCPV